MNVKLNKQNEDIYEELRLNKFLNSQGGTIRKCPKEPAKKFNIKQKKKGLDGKMWIVYKRSNGVKAWKRN